MKILFHLPLSTFHNCFRPVDVDRLRSMHQLQLPVSDDKDVLLKDLTTHAADADVIVTGWGTPRITPVMLDQAQNLKLLIHSAGSIRGLMPEDIWQRGVRTASANGALAVGVAETTLGMIIAGLKGFFPGRDWALRGNWHDPKLGTDHFVMREPFGVAIGVISASKVGLHLLRLLANFEVEILLYDPYVTPEKARALGVRLVSLEELFRQSDVVSLHAPAIPATHHMLRGEHFRSMKDHAIFINTARGTIVDEAALIDELKTGRIFALIDVTDPEPPRADHPFRTLPNVVLTPHLAGHTSNGRFRQGRSVVDQVLEFAAGKVMHGEITAEAFKRMA